MELVSTTTLEVIEEDEITIGYFSGILTYNNLVDFFIYFYHSDNCTRNLVINAADICGERISTKEIRALLLLLEKNAFKRKRGRTALVVNTSLDMTLARVAINLAKNNDFPIELMNFYSLTDAIQWMQSN